MSKVTPRPKADAQPSRREEERKLDQELADSFPASDPPSATNPSRFTGAEDPPPDTATCETGATSDALDEALDESFPASDPAALTRKHGKEDADPKDACAGKTQRA